MWEPRAVEGHERWKGSAEHEHTEMGGNQGWMDGGDEVLLFLVYQKRLMRNFTILYKAIRTRMDDSHEAQHWPDTVGGSSKLLKDVFASPGGQRF